MNQDLNHNSAFSDSTNATQTNPFTGDLKGEFTSDFGTNTNAVSQMFKGDGGGNDRRRTIFIAIGALAAVILLGLLLMDGDKDGFDEFAEEPGEDAGFGLDDDPIADKTDTDPLADADASKDPLADAALGDAKDPLAAEPLGDAPLSEAPSPTTAPTGMTEGGALPSYGNPMASTGSIAISSPFDGASLTYDETQGPATFSWSGTADRIVFARSSAMAPVVRSSNVAGRQSYRFLHPHPGRWFWRLENAEGGTPVQSFVISSPMRRNIPVVSPTPGAQIAGNGGVVQWEGDSKVARYKVELVPLGSSWSTPAFSFGTSGTSIALQGVAAGQYDLRVGGFSEVAGRWEWQVVSGITVQ